jgi:phosphohistidine phosphatase
MKKLILLRHAKSGWDDMVARDFDRPLNAKGKRAARAMGTYLRKSDMHFDQVTASPALRVVETLDQFAEGLGDTLAPLWDKRAYLATAEDMLGIVRETPDAIQTLLFAGHNPGLEDLVLLLVPAIGEDGARDAVEEKYPTASVAEIDFDVARWAEVGAGTGRLVRFVRPRDLDPALGPDPE